MNVVSRKKGKGLSGEVERETERDTGTSAGMSQLDLWLVKGENISGIFKSYSLPQVMMTKMRTVVILILVVLKF